MSLKNVSTEQLEEELKRRKEGNKVPQPLPLEQMNWQPLVAYVQSSVQEVAEEEGEPKDFEHWIFESVMETIYGKDIWKWWNNQF